MRKKNKSIGTKVLCMLLLAAMLLGMSACSGTEPTTTTQAADSESGEVKLAEEQVLNLRLNDLSLIDVNDVRNANEFMVLTAVQEGLFRTFSDENGTDVTEYAAPSICGRRASGPTVSLLQPRIMWIPGCV